MPRPACACRSRGAAATAVFAALPLLLSAAPAGTRVPGTDLELLPESERPFRRAVIGLDPADSTHFMVPAIPGRPGPAGGVPADRLRRQLFMLRIELDHGDVFRCAPEGSRFFVAVPDPSKVPEATGEEPAILREYLTERAGWPAGQVAERVRFFTVPEPLPFPQDMAEVIGFDGARRLVLAVGQDTDECYLEGVRSLVRACPEDFAVRTLGGAGPDAVNTEGGDLSVISMPDGQVGVLVGRHRVVRYLEHRYGTILEGQPIDAARIAEARRAFSAAFFGREVVVVGEAALREPGWVSDLVFHADMVVAVMREGARTVAFVPTFAGRAIDAILGKPIGAERQRMAQREYDLVAGQMAARGFAVVRLPYADHPVRSPVNVSRFLEAGTGRRVVLLPRFPLHLPAATGAPTPQADLEAVFDALAAAVAEWQAKPDQARWDAVQARIEAAWAALRAAPARANPQFDEQAALYQANGAHVVAVPMYASGEGSLHCLIMR